MSSAEITIIKRDGKRKAFSVEKIKNAIRKAFLSVGAFATEEDLVNILSHVRITDGMHVEEIQNQVEIGLMAEQYFTVAKAYMLYRQRHTEDREVRDHLDFLIQYCQAENAATGRYKAYRWKLNRSDKPQVLLRWIHQPGLYGFKYAQRCLRDS